MEKLSLSKFEDKKIKNKTSIVGGEIVDATHWDNCDHHGIDWIDDKGNVGGYIRTL